MGLLLAAGALGLWAVALVAGRSMLPAWVPGVHAPLPPVGERRISSTPFYVLALKPNGDHYAWGAAFHGGLRGYIPKGPDGVVTPMPLEAATGWRYIAAGWDSSYAITRGGELQRRNTGGWQPDYQPHASLFSERRWLKVREAHGQTLGLDTNGRLQTWSEMRARECQSGHARSCEDIHPVGDRSDWVDFCVRRGLDQYFRAFDFWSYAVDRSGKLWLLEPDSFKPKAPVHVPASPRFLRVYCSSYTTEVLLLDRGRRLWRFAKDGPELFSRRTWLAVDSNREMAAGIASDRSLWAWGPFYEKISGKPGTAASPVLVDDTREWAEVEVGWEHLVARTTQGDVYTWGFNVCAEIPACGVLGAGDITYRAQPEPVVIGAP